jgi:hypothetical protein
MDKINDKSKTKTKTNTKTKTKTKKERKGKQERKTRKSILDALKVEYQDNKCNDDNMYSNKECNEIALQKEEIEIQDATNTDNEMLYPTLNDPNFSHKIFNLEKIIREFWVWHSTQIQLVQVLMCPLYFKICFPKI